VNSSVEPSYALWVMGLFDFTCSKLPYNQLSVLALFFMASFIVARCAGATSKKSHEASMRADAATVNILLYPNFMVF